MTNTEQLDFDFYSAVHGVDFKPPMLKEVLWVSMIQMWVDTIDCGSSEYVFMSFQSNPVHNFIAVR